MGNCPIPVLLVVGVGNWQSSFLLPVSMDALDKKHKGDRCTWAPWMWYLCVSVKQQAGLLWREGGEGGEEGDVN